MKWVPATNSTLNRVMSGETQSLLSHPLSQSRTRILTRTHCYPRGLCVPSKAAIIIILWTIVNTSEFAALMSILTVQYFTVPHIYPVPPIYGFIPYITVAVLMIFYPLSGFIADTYCGRFKAIIISQTLITLSLSLSCVVVIVLRNKDVGSKYRAFDLIQGEGIFVLILLISVGILFSAGMIGYQANFIQFGLDQLLEAPSQYLGLFVHYATWASCISYLLVSVVIDILLHYSSPQHKKIVLLTGPFLLTASAFLLLLLSCSKHHWFYREPGTNNPYKTVCKVLQFARKYKYPLHRSAFTYCDDYRHSRLDFAKERFGGPFSTEQVEDVKTLLKVVLILLAIGPVFSMDPPFDNI